ncbi:hypothetical protein D3C85_1544840 [compost metagenome]
MKSITSANTAVTPDSANGHQDFFPGVGAGASTPSSSGSACMPSDLIASMIGAVSGRLWVTPNTRLIKLNSSCCTPASLPSLFWIRVCSVGQSMASIRKRLRRASPLAASLSCTREGAASWEQQLWACLWLA